MIGVVGLGTMGLGIAQVFAQAGMAVLATDSQPAARASAPARMADALNARVAKGALDPAARDATLARLRVVAGPEGLAPAMMVIEAIVERRAAKAALFAILDGVVAGDAVLASNTSSVSIAAIAAATVRPDRVLGLHFFNPAPAMRLVELVHHVGTDPAAQALARRATEAAGKVVIACADRPGFIVNRCARPYYGEALALLEQGRNPGAIDAAMRAAGYPLGPFALIDLIGADINLAATRGLHAAMGGHPRYHVFAALAAQVAAGRLGRKSGQGFVLDQPQQPAPPDAALIVQRIEATAINEACWLLAEGGVTAEGIDTALRLGLNWPRGPFALLDRIGAQAVRTLLTRCEAEAPAHLKGRYLPAPGLAGA